MMGDFIHNKLIYSSFSNSSVFSYDIVKGCEDSVLSQSSDQIINTYMLPDQYSIYIGNEKGEVVNLDLRQKRISYPLGHNECLFNPVTNIDILSNELLICNREKIILYDLRKINKKDHLYSISSTNEITKASIYNEN